MAPRRNEFQQSSRRARQQRIRLLSLGAVALTVALASPLRQGVGGILVEAYALLVHPLWPGPTQFEWVREAEEVANMERLIFLEKENRRIKELIGLPSAIPRGSGLKAPVIGRSPAVWWRQLTLGRGGRHGIRVGHAVLAPGGLIGRITAVTTNTAQVTLVTDPTSRIGVLVTRTNHHGLLSGLGTGRPVLRFLTENPRTIPGDVVVTSSASTLVPGGIPVGVVQNVDRNRAPSPEAVVQPSAPIDAIEWAEVLLQDLPAPAP
ncbi:MAG: rod shape-determining protein MreC [Cyanobacteria bacterium MAG CAR4_bin_6]|nr:rod shape-determining protein MreC [Cyanobacteria bacterium MAG CAR4_bin_6]MCY4236460.1 rod shape-determining protein MreC [Cyanobacteria bacterium MAG CAR2_bin_4]MCY4331906.1 rod shape-determining protein MreC [Cyanobacteria bacterium MAG CAR1_bin_15]